MPVNNDLNTLAATALEHIIIGEPIKASIDKTNAAIDEINAHETSIESLTQTVQQLAGITLAYNIFAFDTQATMASYDGLKAGDRCLTLGKTTVFDSHIRAWSVSNSSALVADGVNVVALTPTGLKAVSIQVDKTDFSCFATIADLLANTELKNNSFCMTMGSATAFDSYMKVWVISDNASYVPNGKTILNLNRNNLKAVQIKLIGSDLYTFDTTALMLANTDIENGNTCLTLGKTTAFDGYFRVWKITNGSFTPNGKNILNVGRDNLKAVQIKIAGASSTIFATINLMKANEDIEAGSFCLTYGDSALYDSHVKHWAIVSDVSNVPAGFTVVEIGRDSLSAVQIKVNADTLQGKVVENKANGIAAYTAEGMLPLPDNTEYGIIKDDGNFPSAVLPVGMEYYVGYSELDAGQLLADGTEVTRATYKSLWNVISTRTSQVKTEEEWQAYKTAHPGEDVPFYSSGDGSTSFRLPLRASHVVQAFGVVTNVGGLDVAALAADAAAARATAEQANTTANKVAGVTHILERNTAYQVGDCLKHPALPSWAYLECTVAGITGTEEPTELKSSGQLITDGTATFIVRSISTSGFPLGLPVFVPFNFVPEGFVNGSLGTMVARDLYQDLYKEISEKYPHLMLTEEAWQAYATANEGCCPFYSSGDGSTTFRLPKILYYGRASEDSAKYGTFETDKQRNIEGFLGGNSGAIQSQSDTTNMKATGAFTYTPVAGGNSSGTALTYSLNFDASRSVGTEHTGTEVQPKTVFGMCIIRAFDSVSNAGNVDVQQVVSAQTVTDTRVTELENTRAFNDKLSMPVATGVTINVTTSGQIWTAPSDGWINAQMYPSSNASAVLFVGIESSRQLRLHTSDGGGDCAFLPVTKGDILHIEYLALNWGSGVSQSKVVFYPALSTT